MSEWKLAQSAELEYWMAQNLKGIERQLSFMLRYFFRLSFNVFIEQTVLEIGTGPVGFVSFIKAKKKYGIEPLKDKFEQIFPALKDIEYVGEKGEQIELPDNSVDTVLCFNVIPAHVDNVDKCLSEIVRVLKLNGMFVFGMKDDQKDKYHRHIYSRTAMKQKMEQYLEIDKIIDKYRMYGILAKKVQSRGDNVVILRKNIT